MIALGPDFRLFIGALAALAILEGCGREEAAESRQATERPVVPYSVQFSENTRDVQAVGTARARAATVVTAESEGIVEEVLFEAGAFVEAGEPLLRLDDDDEALSLNLADVTVREAEQLLERYRRIEDTGAVSDSAIDDAITQLEAARIGLDRAKLRLAERVVTSPFAGYVGLTDIDPGFRVDLNTPITTLDDRRVLYIDFAVPEDVFGQLSVGDEVAATAFSEGDQARPAQIVYLDSRVDPNSRSFRARAALGNDDDSLRPGMSFEVRFSIPGRLYPTVPEAAIVWGSNGSYLWAVKGGAATQIPVQIIARQGGNVLVEGDLPRGRIIVAEGVQKVREGTKVKLLAPAGGGAGQSAAPAAPGAFD